MVVIDSKIYGCMGQLDRWMMNKDVWMDRMKYIRISFLLLSVPPLVPYIIWKFEHSNEQTNEQGPPVNSSIRTNSRTNRTTISSNSNEHLHEEIRTNERAEVEHK